MTDPRIRPADDDDWPRIWPFFSAIVRAGETYAFPEDLTVETGYDWWMERRPGLTVVLEDHGHVVGSAKMGPTARAEATTSGRRASWSIRVTPDRVSAEPWRRTSSPGTASRGTPRSSSTPSSRPMHRQCTCGSFGFEVIGTVPGAFRSRRSGEVGLHVMHLPLR